MTRPITTLVIAVLPALLPTLTGCMFRDNGHKDDQWGDGPNGHANGDCDTQQGDTADTGAAQNGDHPAANFWLEPDTAAPGESLIASLQADVAFDWSSVQDVVFYGDVIPCTTQAREDELLITITVNADAAPGPVDLLIELNDGGAIWVDGAMTVVDGGAGSGGTGGTGSTSGNSSGNSSAGGGACG
ncbi:MAG: hypothetical protein GXP62_07545 [Oligoflexia bacterium]|nr:hypothetical protein [Oligoflexia bacterium]